MKRNCSLLGLSLLFILITGAAFGQAAGLSISNAGRTSGGKALYDLKAEGADVIDVLKQLFSRAGVGSFEISPEIRQSVSLQVKGATADELIERVRNVASPPLNIMTNGRTVYVSRSTGALSRAEEIKRRMEANQLSRLSPGVVPSGLTDAFAGAYRDARALEAPVTLNVPDDRPITLGAALQLLEKQTRVPIRLDPSLPSDIKFSGVVTRVPLRSVLQNIAPGTGEGSLKVVTLPNQILIAPSDRFSIHFGPGVISSNLTCSRCRHALLTTWSFCPSCGQATRRGQLQGSAPVPGTNIRKPNPLRPE